MSTDRTPRRPSPDAPAVRERPILFSAPMIRAILAGRKSMTRRVIKPQPEAVMPCDYVPGHWAAAHDRETHEGIAPRCLCTPLRPFYGDVGDRLWVKHPAGVFGTYYKPIVGYEGSYAAGTDGHVYRVDGPLPRRLIASPSTKGYPQVTLCVGNRKATQFVHVLICEAFYGPRPGERWQVRHLNGDQTDSSPGNLDWGTPEDNWSDRKALGRGQGEEHHSAKLTDAQVGAIREGGESIRALAERYGVSPSTICAARNGHTWATAADPAPRNFPEWTPWRSSLFMPRWASHLTLEITAVRVERVRDITEADALAEGGWTYATCPIHKAPEASFAQLWDSINAGRGFGWQANPWVWVLGFRRVEQERSVAA